MDAVYHQPTKMSNVANGPGGKAEKAEHEKASPAAHTAQQGLPVFWNL